MIKYPIKYVTLIVFWTACGGNSNSPVDASMGSGSDASTNMCQPIGSIGNFYRRTPAPRLIAGTHTYTNNSFDIAITDPDLRWDDTSSMWELFYHGPNAATYQGPITPMIRHAQSADLTAWTIDDAPALVAPSATTAWDHGTTEMPTVVYNPAAAADRRYLMLYSGGKDPNYQGLGFYNYAIGAAFSADGKTFMRVSAGESPHSLEGQVLTAADVFSGSEGIVADPEVALVNGTYQLWFSSFACNGANCSNKTAYGISHATSTDGIHWIVAEAPVHTLLRMSAVPTSGGAQPSVIYDAAHCRYEMWLHSDSETENAGQPVVFNNMAGVWHATSQDGASWSVNYAGARDVQWNATTPDAGEHLGLRTGADVAAKGTSRYMVYSGFDNQNVPTGSTLPDGSQQGFEAGVITLNVAARDAL
ncbi:hypothetical protein BH11MYX1_BH11MYX1_03680 [soil metagenome]